MSAPPISGSALELVAGHTTEVNRLGLIHYVREIPSTWDVISDEKAAISGVRFTVLGCAFVQACRQPPKTRAPGRRGSAESRY